MEYNYTHGGDVYRNPIEYDFSINVNPLGMPLASIQAAHEGIVLTGRYPDYRAEQLCRWRRFWSVETEKRHWRF